MTIESISPKIRARAVFISDVHLGFRDCKADYLLSFLDNIETDTLYLLGDIVDLWSLKKRLFWPNTHYDVLKRINEIAASGTRVIYIPGNHDETCREYVGMQWGKIEVHHELIHETARGKKLLLMHGDCLDGAIRLNRFNRIVGDHAYALLLFLNRWHNRIRRRFGYQYWSLAAYIKNRVKNARAAIDVYEEAAIHLAKSRGLDGVVCGHIHQPEIVVKDGMLYCNDGDWVENCTALTEDQTGNMRLLHWSERKQAIKSLSLIHI